MGKFPQFFSRTIFIYYSKVLLVHLWADWAPQCQQITDVLDELAKDAEYSNCGFVKVSKSKHSLGLNLTSHLCFIFNLKHALYCYKNQHFFCKD